MSNKLQGWLAPNTLTEDPNDRILVLNSAGTVDNEQLYEEMREEDTGLRRETLVHVVTLYERIVARALKMCIRDSEKTVRPALAQAWRSFIDYNPDNGILAMATQLGEAIEIYNLNMCIRDR